MKAAIEAATAKGIPVVAFNAGADAWQSMGGSRSSSARTSTSPARARVSAWRPTVPRRPSASSRSRATWGLESRCAGVKNAFPPATEVLNVNGKDMPSVESTITAKLQQDPGVDYVVTLGAPFAMTAVQSVKNAASKAKVGTFDTNAALVDAIKAGDVQWAVDQQPFLQGYLAVDSLWLYINNGNVLGGGQPTLTGPSFIDKSNIDAVAEYAKAGTR